MPPKHIHGKHEQPLPSLRHIRRTCQRELYRTAKKLKRWIPPNKMEQARQLYVQKVIGNLPWIIATGNNRTKLCDWWEKEVCPSIAELWEVSPERLAHAFRTSFGG